jgi:hypothetical protein
MICPEKFCHLRVKLCVREDFWYARNIFWDALPPPPPVGNISWEKILCALFIRKVPLEAWPSQLLDASYAPAVTVISYQNAGDMVLASALMRGIHKP